MDVDLLRTVSILRKLSEEEMRSFCALLSLHEYQAKDRIVEEGAPIKNFYIVCDGVVHIRRLAHKRELLLGRLGPGGFFGEINLFDPGMATASIYAMKPTRIACIDYTKFHHFMQTHCETGYKIVSSMMTEMCRRLRQTSARLVNNAYWANAEGALPRPGPVVTAQ